MKGTEGLFKENVVVCNCSSPKADEATGFAKERKPAKQGRACVFVKCGT